MEPPGSAAAPASAEPEAASAPAAAPAPTVAVAAPEAPAAVPPAGAAAAAAGNTSPLTSISKSDLKTFRTWFDYADTDGDGRLTALDAVPFFRRSGLSSEELKGVWACADAGKRGFLSFNDFIIAMQLIWQLQRGAMGLTVGEGSIVPHMEGLEAAMKGEAAQGADASKAGAAASVASMPRQGSAGWFAPREAPNPAAVTSVVDGLKALYRAKLKPLETTYRFHDFVSPMLRDSDFDAKPMVMLLGQYSTGKTTFIKHLLGQPYPGAHIGPEPTTDRFVVVMNGADQRTIPGNTVAVQADMPFAGLTKFGSTFLEKLEVSQMRHPLLEQFSLVDTPGVLSGEKQRTMRSYDFTGVTEWFATKCDLILLLFDPHKLDVSDEFKRVIASLHGNFDKIRIVLNKADSIDTQQLMRVYGALMWSLGKVINTPEVMRVYIGSFNDRRRSQDQAAADADSNGDVGRGRAGAAALLGRELFEREENDLLIDLIDIPRKSCDRKINEFVKRARSARVNAFVISHLRAQMPMFGRPRAQQRLIETLKDEFAKIEREHHVPAGDFPRVELMQQALAGYSFDTFERLKPKLIEDVDRMLAYDVPELLKRFRNPYG